MMRIQNSVLAKSPDLVSLQSHFFSREVTDFWQWHPTPVLLPGKSQGWGSLVGCRLWGHTESDTTEAISSSSRTSLEKESNWRNLHLNPSKSILVTLWGTQHPIHLRFLLCPLSFISLLLHSTSPPGIPPGAPDSVAKIRWGVEWGWGWKES